jgi:hypothetical protein
MSHWKRKIATALAGTLASRKVSIDNDKDKKALNDPISMLKTNPIINPGMHICSALRAFLGLSNEQNRTPMLANTPVVPPKDLQELYKNQVALPKGATNRVYVLFSSLMKMLFVYQDPPKHGPRGKVGPRAHSYYITGCSIYTDSHYYTHTDLRPDNSTILPLALKTDGNIHIFGVVCNFFEDLTLKLGCIMTILYRFHKIWYMCGNGMGRHGGGLCATDQ